MNEYIGIAVAFVLAGGIAVGMVVLASTCFSLTELIKRHGIAVGMVVLVSTLGKKKPSTVKSEPFECGMEPFSLPGGKLAIKFYLTAILFILFDVELVFLYPWAVVYRQLGVVGLVEMGVFLGILMVGYVYAWDSGALEWQ